MQVSILDEEPTSFDHCEVDILECFDLKNYEGNWINIKYKQESSVENDINNVCGVYLLAKIEHEQTSHPFNHNIRGRFLVKFEIDNGNSSNFRYLTFLESKLPSPVSNWVVYLPVKILKDVLMAPNSCFIKATIGFDNKCAKVKACGASMYQSIWQIYSLSAIALSTCSRG